MQKRRDALAGAAEMILAIEDVARTTQSLQATVGKIAVADGREFMVAGEVEFHLDLRSPIDGAPRAGMREIDRRLRAIARQRQLSVKATEILSVLEDLFLRELDVYGDLHGIRFFLLLPDRLVHHRTPVLMKLDAF